MLKKQLSFDLETTKEIGYILEGLEEELKKDYKVPKHWNWYDLVLYEYVDKYRDEAFNGLSNIYSFPYSIVLAFQKKYECNPELKVLKIFKNYDIY